MNVEQACRLSADGTARKKERIRTKEGNILEVSLYAKYNEVQGKYTVTQYFNKQKIQTSDQFRNPHKINGWRPSRRFSSETGGGYQTKSDYNLYLLVSKDKYQFNMGITKSMYSRVFQLRLMWGEFDLETSSIVYGKKKHLYQLEHLLQFMFEEYHLPSPTISDASAKDWFDLDCYWYLKNEIRRLNSFREEKIYRMYEGIDLNAFMVEDSDKLLENVDIGIEE
ncbi:MAG: hypothetical protein MJE63_10185 [Proteobacteria bacterium]|nr:hypothetical protein [Pseudomonadota bacterium]